MAGLDRLPPPNLAGTLPSFYTKADGTTTLVVPFTMNSTVSAAEIAGFAVRIKTTTTDSLIAIHYKTEWDSAGSKVSFELSQDTVGKLVQGDFYKVQLAYYQLNSDGTYYVGYYSTASVAKFTCLPRVYIQGLIEGGIVNSTTARTFAGIYSNEDISEKVYQYKFEILGVDEYASGTRTETIVNTGWLVHDSSNDTQLGTSTDFVTISEAFITGRTYLITYSVRTVNGLEYNSPTYTIVSVANIGIILPFYLKHELRYDDGCVHVTVQSMQWQDPEKVANADALNEASYEEDPLNWRFNGSYQLLRTDSNSNYLSWIPIYIFTSTDLFSNWSYDDYTVQSGVGYRYGIEKINQTDIKSRRAESYDSIIAYFEDMFLYDGERQLKIRFNSNVQQFKEVISETKKTTLGRKYPIIMRNGTLQYKEFNITGLLSYLSDPNELFISKDELLNDDIIKDANKKDSHSLAVFTESTDLTDLNITAERNFAIEALNWLNNGKIKLFRSPQEGNFIVKLTNVSLSPENVTGRMLRTFSATASEVAEFSFEQLVNYDLVSQSDGGVIWQSSIVRFYIHQEREKLRQQYQNTYTGDNLSDKVADELEAIDMTDGYPCIRVEVYSPTGAGQAKIMGTQFEWGKYHWAVGPTNRYIIELDEPYEAPLRLVNANGLSDAGIVEMTLMKNVASIDEATETQYVSTYYGWSGYGVDEVTESGYTDNILAELATRKRCVTQEYYMEIHSYPLIVEEDVDFADWWADPANAQQVEAFKILYDQYVFYYDKQNDKYYRYDGTDLIETEYNLYIKVHDQEQEENQEPIDVNAMQHGAAMPELNYSDPKDTYLALTNGVYANIYYQTQTSIYTIEKQNSAVIEPAKNAADAYENWCALAFNMEEVNSQNTTQMNSPYLFIFTDDGRFAQVTKSEYIDKYQAKKCYRPYAGTYTKAQIKAARDLYRVYSETLDAVLALNL